MRGRSFALVGDIKIMFVAIGWWSTLRVRIVLPTDHPYCSGVPTSPHFILSEGSFMLLEAMMLSLSTRHARNTTSRMTLGVGSLILMSQGTLLPAAFSIINTFMCSLAELSSTRKRLQIQLRCMTSIWISGERLTWTPRVHGQPVIWPWACKSILRQFWSSEGSIKLWGLRSVSTLMLRITSWRELPHSLRWVPSLTTCLTSTLICT